MCSLSKRPGAGDGGAPSRSRSIRSLENPEQNDPFRRPTRYFTEKHDGLASGMTAEEILADYEDMEPQDIQAVLAYAARLVRANRIEYLAA
uniref:DUF433 domain-containing protein n=1 Tax=Candidatus Kentrum sp. TUN TaxID=2126343 RepID=A0A451A1F1_9GAMM|nr:MAG: Protein of unknown function (DUF433) [Candidatus Kentron sp. TUN]VFK59859.1 MAG: Protein of unknown function (DUF433) [Candidatus Kentron sp. TUN]VFK64898.1 MAG: Protein of unknown function (DUF433) [Candidatus Kentron sp. TUN]